MVAVIRIKSFKNCFVQRFLTKRINEISLLSQIPITQPQAAYMCFVAGYQHMFTSFLRTIPEIGKQLVEVDEIIRHQFIPAITCGHIVNDTKKVGFYVSYCVSRISM